MKIKENTHDKKVYRLRGIFYENEDEIEEEICILADSLAMVELWGAQKFSIFTIDIFDHPLEITIDES